MRMIGSIDNRNAAEKFGAYLYLQKIENRIEAESDGDYGIWIFDEAKIPAALALLKRFAANPHDPEFHRVSGQAQMLKMKERIQDRMSRNRTVDMRTHWHQYNMRIGPVSAGLIGICVALALLSNFGSNTKALQYFFITDFHSGLYYLTLPEVRHGQVWRLITPIFLHFGFLHLLFNMMWLKDLGSIIEQRLSSLYLLLMVVVIGILSNLAQFYWSGPQFGGMSGVIYGLLGYMWIRGRYDPGSGLSLNQSVVVMMIVWFFLCLFGVIGHVANTAHGAGLVIGMLWGFIAAKTRRA